jgi:hypothetical protein
MISDRKSRNPDRKPGEEHQESNQEEQVVPVFGKQVFTRIEGRLPQCMRQDLARK